MTILTVALLAQGSRADAGLLTVDSSSAILGCCSSSHDAPALEELMAQLLRGCADDGGSGMDAEQVSPSGAPAGLAPQAPGVGGSIASSRLLLPQTKPYHPVFLELDTPPPEFDLPS